MRRLFELRVLLVILAVVTFLGGAMIAFAQPAEPDVLQPSTWLASAEAVMAIGAILASYVVRLTTALGKEWFQTDGPRTKYLAIAISVIVAGVGGYLSLGFLSDVSGISGAFRAAVMVFVGYFGAVAKAEYDRQTMASGADRAEARVQSKLLRP